MRLNKAQLIGLFTIVVVLALYAVITFLKDENLFNGKSTYYIIYEDVDGLTTSSPVYIKGFKVGSIWDIEFDNKSGLFTVLIKVKSSLRFRQIPLPLLQARGYWEESRLILLLETPRSASPAKIQFAAVLRLMP